MAPQISTSVILAGGLGTRLRDTVPNRAKSVASVAGRPFLVHLLNQLWRAGVHRIVLCTGHLSDQVYQEIGSQFEDVEIVYSVEDYPLGTGGALRLAWQRYGEGTDGWLVTNGDSYCDLDLTEFWDAHRSSGLDVTLASVEVADGSRYGSLAWDASGRLTRFGEKVGRGSAGWINAGIYGFKPQFLERLSAAAPLSLERRVFPEWITRGINVFARQARFIDIGTPDSYITAQEFFVGGTR